MCKILYNVVKKNLINSTCFIEFDMQKIVVDVILIQIRVAMFYDLITLTAPLLVKYISCLD